MEGKAAATTVKSGWQVGVRKTFPITLQEAWSFLNSPMGIKVWLGAEIEQLVPGKAFQTHSVSGLINIIKDNSHIRMEWKKREWPGFSTFQIRVFQASSGTTISFHQDNLSNEFHRAEMLMHWGMVLESLDKEFQYRKN